jgi:hypothetical protein
MEELSAYMEQALAGMKLPARRRARKDSPPAPPCLPPGCAMGGHQIRARMEQIAAKCGLDESCYRAGIERIYEDMKQGKMPWSVKNAVQG